MAPFSYCCNWSSLVELFGTVNW